MDGGAWWAAVHGVAKSWTWLSDFTFTFHFHALEKEMATHSSILVRRIPGMGARWAAVYGVTQGRTRLTWLSSSSSNRNYQHVYMRVPSGQNYVLFTVYHVNCCVNCCLVNIKYPIYKHSKTERESKIHISFMFFISQNKIKVFKPAWNPNFRMIWALSNIKQTCTGRDCLIFSHSLLSGITLPIYAPRRLASLLSRRAFSKSSTADKSTWRLKIKQRT